MMDELSDDELWMAARTDPRAFRLLYNRWAEKLMAYFYRRTLDAEVSADLVAETIATAYLRRNHYRKRNVPVTAWLYGIAARELGRFRRRRGAEGRALRKLGVARPEMDAESLARIDELIDLEAYRAELESALARLSNKEREAVRLRVVEEHPYRDVASTLGCSEGAARVRVHRALSRLADWMEAPS